MFQKHSRSLVPGFFAGAIALTLFALDHPASAQFSEDRPDAVGQLTGTVLLEDPEGGTTPATRHRVTLSTGAAAFTDDSGRFVLPLPPTAASGQPIRFLVDKPGWVVHLPPEGETLAPAGREPITLTLLPKGSPRLLGGDRIPALIAQIASDHKDWIGTASLDVGPAAIDFRRHLRDWGLRHGLETARLEAAIAGFAERVEAQRGDLHTRALAAFAKKDLAAAYELASAAGEEASAAAVGPAGSGRDQERDLAQVEAAVRGYRLAGDAASAEHRFAQAIEAYAKALKLIDRARMAEPWAATTADLAKARYLTVMQWRFGSREREYARLASAASAHIRDAPRYMAAAVRASAREQVATARASYFDALAFYTREARPWDWARTQLGLGLVLELEAKVEGTQRDSRRAAAATAYREALGVYRPEASPAAWARTQRALGNVLFNSVWDAAIDDCSRREQAGDGAIQAFRSALQVLSPESAAEDWAMTQVDLGKALDQRAQHHRPSGAWNAACRKADECEAEWRDLSGAGAAYRKALRILTREREPEKWAEAQQDLGEARARQCSPTPGRIRAFLGFSSKCLPALGKAEQSALCAEAAAAFRAALTVKTREANPEQWAELQKGLGDALRRQAGGRKHAHLQQEAAGAYRQALTVMAERLPWDWPGIQGDPDQILPGPETSRWLSWHDWFHTQWKLGNVLEPLALGTPGEAGTALLSEAAVSYRAALEGVRRLGYGYTGPEEYQSLASLGRILLEHGKRTPGQAARHLLGEAAVAYRAAVEAVRRNDWTDLELEYLPCLGRVLLEQGKRAPGAEGGRLLAESKEVFQEARARIAFRDRLWWQVRLGLAESSARLALRRLQPW